MAIVLHRIHRQTFASHARPAPYGHSALSASLWDVKRHTAAGQKPKAKRGEMSSVEGDGGANPEVSACTGFQPGVFF